MKKITPMTTYISMDEKAFCLAEINATPFSLGILSDQKGMRGIHRYRFIWVNRDGKLALFREESANPVTSPPALMRKNHSSFGTQVKVQRNGYPESLNKEVKLRYT